MAPEDVTALEIVYREARELPLRDSAYLLWTKRFRLNDLEKVKDGPAFPPLPEGETKSLLPEIYRRAKLSMAYEARPENLPSSRTFARLLLCHPDAGAEGCASALREVYVLDDEVHRAYRQLMTASQKKELDCIRAALQQARDLHPGLVEATYTRASHQLGWAIR